MMIVLHFYKVNVFGIIPGMQNEAKNLTDDIIFTINQYKTNKDSKSFLRK